MGKEPGSSGRAVIALSPWVTASANVCMFYSACFTEFMIIFQWHAAKAPRGRLRNPECSRSSESKGHSHFFSSEVGFPGPLGQDCLNHHLKQGVFPLNPAHGPRAGCLPWTLWVWEALLTSLSWTAGPAHFQEEGEFCGAQGGKHLVPRSYCCWLFMKCSWVIVLFSGMD